MRIRPRGITLVELLIAVGGMVIVMGAAFEVYEETQSASIKMTNRQAATDYAVRVMDQAVELINNAVNPADLESASGARGEFKRFLASFPVMMPGEQAALSQVSIRPAKRTPGSHASGAQYQIIESPLPATEGKAVASSVKSLGGRAEKFHPILSFRYATEAKPGQAIAYVDQLESAEWPRLVEITLRVDLPDSPDQPILLQTAVMPGRVNRDGGAR